MLLSILSGLATTFLFYLLLFIVNDLFFSKNSRLKRWYETFTYFSQGLYELEIQDLEQRVIELEQKLEQVTRDDRNRTSIKRLGQDTGQPPKPTK